MSSSAVSAVGTFMKSPLVSWAKTFQDEEKKILEYRCLCDGLFIYNMWLEIDPHPPYHGISSSTDDLATRVRNLDIILHNIKAFYEEVLGQLLLIKVPDILTLAKLHDEQSSVGEMEILLLLILGCAVQCERKEHFIEIIKSMDLEIQHKIVDYIQKITDNPESIWISEWNELPLVPPEDQEHMYNLLVQHLRRLVKEKDELSQRVIQSALQNLCFTSGTSTLSPTSSTSIDKSHLIVELADVKARLRKLQQEVEEKNEGITELKEELEKSKESQCKLRQENLELIQDARTAKTYRDEIDILKERVHKVDRLESEIQRYKDKMNELDFYKSRVEELREDNRILVETKSMLEEQLEASRKRAEQVVELEAEILKYCSQINELSIERDSDKEKIQQLLEENAQLHIERKASMEELVQLQSELSQAFTPSPLENHSLMEQLNTETQTRVLQLELENKRLHMLVESLNRSPSFEISDPETMKDMEDYVWKLDLNSWKNKAALENIGNLRKEHKALKEKNNHLEKEIAELKVEAKKFTSLELQCADFEKLVNELKQALKIQQVDISKCEQLEHSLNSITTENQKLQKMVDSNQQRMKDLQQDMQALENENQKLNNTVESLKLTVRKYHDLERETTNLETINHRLEQEMKGLEKENNRLKIAMESKDLTIEEYASRVAYLDRENKHFVKEVENLNQIANKLRDLERENKDVMQQTAVDKKSLEALRQDLVAEKIANQRLNNEIQKFKSQVEARDSPREVFVSDHEILLNELKGADKFLCDEECKSEDKVALNKCCNIDYNRTSDEVKETGDKAFEDLMIRSPDTSAKQNEFDRSSEYKDQSLSKKRIFSNEKDEIKFVTLREELEELKADVMELEKKKSSVEEENCNLNNQVSSLRDQNNNLKSQLESVEQHLTSVVSHNNSLQSKLAKLEVEVTVVSSQNKTLNHQKSQFQLQVSNLEEQVKKVNMHSLEMENRNRSLATDHDSLQRLHEQLTNDYDSLIKVHSSLKAHHKSLKAEYNDLKEKMQSVLISHEEVMRLRQVLEDDDSRVDSRLLNSLRADHIQLKEQLKSLREAHEGVTKELKSLQAIHKSLKTENNELKLKHTALQGELLECQNETSSLDVEVSKLTNCCELLTQKNTMMEEEQQSLMSHLSILLGQYHELLYQVISEQSQFRKEENSFREKLRELCQQKEKLEQKIIDHSNKLQRSPKRKSASGGSMRMRRTRSAFLRNSKHDALSSQSDNSTDSSLYCSLRRPNKPIGWSFKNKGNMINPEDSCQEDHIPVRDVGLGVQKDGNEQNILSTEKDDASSELLKDMGPKHTTLENNMTLNFITNLTNADVMGCNPSQAFSRSASSQQISSYNLGRHCTSDNSFQPLSYIASDVLHCPQVANKPARPLSAYCSDTNSNIDTTEASKFSRTKTEKSDPNSSRGSSKEKSLENSVWYEYGCV
ncbi:protein Daple [Trichonephila inaurata madagascariensis]|uniref:Protein Daple n=1 Tax=Trichonephila inaurata madagascariensis TaxID=2747483 RepID=A0A8X6XDX4_9ARAC|nr:protein Daple [Trichonephila inaurata madagascariensis]